MFSSDIADITKGTLFGRADLPVGEIVTDSRHLYYSEGIVFIAIAGKNHDGHIFIDSLYNEGIRIFVVEKMPVSIERFEGAAIIVTKNSVNALQILASYKRKSFKSPVIAVTGSTGKTVVKEWLADILGLTTSIVRSPKSYNSQIGVPLSVLKLDDKYKLGIFEAGISLPGEMDKLRDIIDPDIGVFTNIGEAHSENFKDERSKAVEKLKLFSNASSVIYCRDQELINQLITTDKNLKTKNIYGWSFKDPGSEIFVRRVSSQGNLTTVQMTFKGQTNEFVIPFIDRASVENAVTAAVVCLVLGIQPGIIAKGLRELVSVAMRMEIRSGINNCQLIEDFYNSDPGSLGMAIEYLKLQNNRDTTLILSDFIQSGRDEDELYNEVAGLVKKSAITRFIGIGQALSRHKFKFDNNARFFTTTDEFLKKFNSNDYRNQIILLKGARVYEFEKIGNLLEQKIHQTVLEINLDAISHNLNEFRRCLNPGTKIMVMVKAFAYGSGPSEIAALMEYHRVNYLAVAYADEGVELRNAGVSLPIMVMNPDPFSSEVMIKYSLEPEIYSFPSFEKFVSVAEKHGIINYPVHLKIDTGMHRLGFMPEEVGLLAQKVKNTGTIRVVSVFSHLSASEEASLDSFTKRQVELFLQAVEQIKAATGYPFLRHILNSTGIVRFPQYQFDMVRPGIGIYGVGRFEGLTLRNSGSFKTRISQAKRIVAGEPVGYGCTDVSPDDRIIAILPVGYADGLNRRLGNRNGSFSINGHKVPIIGNVCMDMCMVDITGTGAEAGDEAEVFGENITIEEIAAQCQTIPYEILTSIPGRVKRIFFRE